MTQLLIALILIFFAAVVPVSAQPVPVTPEVPFSNPAAAADLLITEASEARTTCGSYLQEGYLPYRVRVGDTLENLLLGSAQHPVQVAQANCLTTTGALPFGLVIGLPTDAFIMSPLNVTRNSDMAVMGAFAETTFNFNLPTGTNEAPPNLRWAVLEETSAVYVFPCPADPDAPCSRPAHMQPVEAQGEIELPRFTQPGEYRFGLERVIPMAETPTLVASVEITCAHEWMLTQYPPQTCPIEPAAFSFGAYQPLENGIMIYRQNTGSILVLTNDGLFTEYSDTYVEGQPDPTDEPPADRVTPIRGFGLVWSALGGAESGLGFGLFEEQGYDLMTQPAGTLTYYINIPDGIFALTRLPGETVGHWVRVE